MAQKTAEIGQFREGETGNIGYYAAVTGRRKCRHTQKDRLMPGAIHEIAVAKIMRQYPGAKTKKMLKSLRTAMEAEGENAEPDVFRGFGVIPDAYIVDAAARLLTVIEVEAGTPLTNAKMEIYCDLWWTLDDVEWDMILITVDRWGNQTSIHDMGDFAIDKIVHDAKRSGARPRPSDLAFVAELRKIAAQ